VKRLAAFQNPEFYKKQSMRLSTATTPRVINCAGELPQHVALPRGCLYDVEALLRAHGVALTVDDQRVQGASLESPILLTERKDHLEYFATRLQPVARHLVVLQGGMGAKAHRAVQAQLAGIPSSEERLVLATGRYIGEGFDDARLDTLFLAMPVSWKGTLVQYTGRLHRLHPGKRVVRIFDYVDREVPMLLRMFEKRLRGYRAIGYARGEAPLGYAAPSDDQVIEYDKDVLAALDQEDEFA
jgi:hypothetical protein